MGMRETVGSMRAYFFLAGVVTMGQFGLILRDTRVDNLTVVIVSAMGALFGGGFFYSAITLKTAVEYARTKAIEVILYVNIALGVLAGLLALLTTEEKHIASVRIIITLVIGFYLLANLKRLVKEHAAAVAELVPTPPPPIPATQSPPEVEVEGQEADGD